MNDIVATDFISIPKGQYARLPNTPPGPESPCLPGPAQLKLIRYRDGRLAHEIIQGEPKPTRLALIKKMRLVAWTV